jgi:peptide/nickel transport system substrate-binding protein
MNVMATGRTVGRMSRRQFIGATAGLVLASACGTGTKRTAMATSRRRGGTLRVAIGTDPNSLDPLFSLATVINGMMQQVLETLVAIDEQGHLQPLLAESWNISPDSLTYTFVLRKGVTFHDGTPFNASAVVANVKRLLDPTVKSPSVGILGTIRTVTAVDDYRVQFTLSETLPPFVSALSQQIAAILSPTSFTQKGNTYGNIVYPVGTGPYQFREFVKGSFLNLDRNPTYWGQKAYYEHQYFQIVPDSASREALLKADQVDVIELPPPADIAALQSSPDVRVIMAPSWRTVFIGINNLSTTQPLLRDVRVRQALNYAVDKEAIIKNVVFNAARPMTAPIPDTLFGYCRTGTYAYNPARARNLLVQAGAAGMSVKLISPTGRYLGDIQAAEAVANYFRKVGIKVDGPSTMDWPSYLATFLRPPSEAVAELYLLGWDSSYPDAQYYMQQFDSRLMPPKGLEESYYTNPEVDSLITRANTSVSYKVRQQAYCRAEHLIWQDAPWVWLYNPDYVIAHSAKVGGVSYRPNETFWLAYAYPT